LYHHNDGQDDVGPAKALPEEDEHMQHHHPFRFAVAPAFTTAADWIETARKMEALGYSTILSSDHPGMEGIGPFSALMMAAAATTTLRVGTHVLANDFRNPVMLAQEAATLDLLSGGRFEFGLGTGWYRDDYDVLGISFDRPGIRVRRLEEAVSLIKGLFLEDGVTFSGRYYTANNVHLRPKPASHPHPPLFIGGGGKRILSLAAREADVVGVDALGTPAGPKDLATTTSTALAQQIGWVREAAGSRFETLELHLLVYMVAVTEHRRQAAEQIAQFTAYLPPSIMVNTHMTADDALASPRVLIGSKEQIIEQLQALREQYGISYISILQFPGFADLEAFSPIVARLAGT
jgi:probable F420-dependent oxidoreductase